MDWAVLHGAYGQDKRQRAETDVQEVPPEHGEELLFQKGNRTLSRLPREAVESPSLERFKSHLNTILSNVLWQRSQQKIFHSKTGL